MKIYSNVIKKKMMILKIKKKVKKKDMNRNLHCDKPIFFSYIFFV